MASLRVRNFRVFAPWKVGGRVQGGWAARLLRAQSPRWDPQLRLAVATEGLEGHRAEGPTLRLLVIQHKAVSRFRPQGSKQNQGIFGGTLGIVCAQLGEQLRELATCRPRMECRSAQVVAEKGQDTRGMLSELDRLLESAATDGEHEGERKRKSQRT